MIWQDIGCKIALLRINFSILFICDFQRLHLPLREKVSKYGVISGLHIPTFGLNTERYFITLRIQSECGKIRTKNNSLFGHFSRSVHITKMFMVLHELREVIFRTPPRFCKCGWDWENKLLIRFDIYEKLKWDPILFSWNIFHTNSGWGKQRKKHVKGKKKCFISVCFF